jgi:hypothetical protein
MPFDGAQRIIALRSVVALNTIITFFEREGHWQHDRFCRHVGRRHTYAGGRMCLTGALEEARAEGAPNDVRRYVERSIRERTGAESIEAFNAETNHENLVLMLIHARTLALIEVWRLEEIAKVQAERDRAAGIEARRQREIAAAQGRFRSISSNLLASMKPTGFGASAEVALLNDLIGFFEKPASRPCGPASGVGLRQVMHHFRKARGRLDDLTTSYLRRAFRRIPWTFGTLKGFDARADREDMLNVLWRARELAEANIKPLRRAA